MDPVYKWISTNPNKHHLPTFSTTTNDDTEKEKWEGFQKALLPLPGALSGILYCVDPMFRESTPSLQRQIMMEKILELQERVPNDLVGRRWSRKKILELLSAELAEKAPTSEVALEESLCELFAVQKIQISLQNKTIKFFPSDIRVWKRDRPVFVFDSENLWVYENPELKMGKALHDWIVQKEDEKWTIGWPVADGKLEELKVALEKKNLTPRSMMPGQKIKKDDYSRTLGRAEAISILCSRSP